MNVKRLFDFRHQIKGGRPDKSILLIKVNTGMRRRRQTTNSLRV
jgi:hypothetical protein